MVSWAVSPVGPSHGTYLPQEAIAEVREGKANGLLTEAASLMTSVAERMSISVIVVAPSRDYFCVGIQINTVWNSVHEKVLQMTIEYEEGPPH